MWLSLMRLTVSWLLSRGSRPTLLYAHVASAKSTVLSAKGYECIAFTSCATGRNMTGRNMLVQNQTTFSASHAQAYWAHLDHVVDKNEVSELEATPEAVAE